MMYRCVPIIGFFLFSIGAFAQSLSPTVIGAMGGSATVGSIRIDHTVGETVITTLDANGLRLTQGFHQAEPLRLRLNIRAFLQGPHESSTGSMRDDLRSAGYIPMTEPYTALGFAQVGGGGEITSPAVLSTSGDDAIVDWVFLELRDKNDNSQVLSTHCALLQSDGDIVDTDGTSAVAFAAPADLYFVSVQHRNHLAVLTLGTVALSSAPTSVDLTDGSAATFGTDAQLTLGAVRMLWCGDVIADGVLKYTGTNNDRDPILVAIGGSVPTNTVAGYAPTDVNMDGITKYTGTGNDRDPILVNIGGNVPTNVRNAQLP